MSLRARRQSVKLALFLKFRVVLVLAAAASALRVHCFLFPGRGADEDAKLVWIVEVVPDIVYLCIFGGYVFMAPNFKVIRIRPLPAGRGHGGFPK